MRRQVRRAPPSQRIATATAAHTRKRAHTRWWPMMWRGLCKRNSLTERFVCICVRSVRIVACFTHPLDTVKVRMQTFASASGGGAGAKLGFGEAIVTIVHNEGPLALYNGISASLLRQFSYTTVRLGMYEALKPVIQVRCGFVVRACVARSPAPPPRPARRRGLNAAAVVRCRTAISTASRCRCGVRLCCRARPVWSAVPSVRRRTW